MELLVPCNFLKKVFLRKI